MQTTTTPKIENQIRTLELQLELLRVQQNLSDTDLRSVDSSRYTSSCIANLQEGVPIMSTAGTIRTKQRCKNCDSKFIDTGQLMVCPECLKQQKISMPTRFYLDFFWNGKQRKIYSDNDGRVLNNYELANRVLIEILQKIDKHRFDPADYVAKNYMALQFDTYAKKWVQKYKGLLDREIISPMTYIQVERYVRKYYIPFFKISDIRDLKTGDVEDFHLNLPKNLSLATQKNILIILHKLFTDAKRRRDIKEIPEFPQIQLDEPKTRWLDEETQDKIYDCIPDRHKPIFLFLIRQGIRPGEARALYWEDIDWKNKTVTICRTFSRDVYRKKTKTKNTRILPLDDDVYNMLLQIRGDRIVLSGFVFIQRNGRPYKNVSGLNCVWDKAVKEAGIQHISLYEGTRHSVASQAGNRKVDINFIQNFLGHTNASTTRRYTHLNTEGLKIILREKGKVVKLENFSKG